MNESELVKELETLVGKSGGPSRRSAYPIGDAMIHHWCDAIGDRNASYLDPEFAKSGVHGGIVAPPTMLQAWTMAGFRSDSDGADDGERTSKTVLDVLDDAGFTSVVATNCEQEYCRYLTPGDQIRHDVEIESVSAEKKTGLGVGHFVSQLYTYRDAADEIVGRMRFVLLKFRPPSDESDHGPIIGPRIRGGRPRPSLNQDVEFFWEGAANGKLLVQRCTDCQSLRHPPGPGCPDCSSLDWEAIEMSGRGEIYSFVRHHHPKIPPFEAGHPVILVQLDEGPRIISELVEHESDIEIGMRVEVQFDEVEKKLTLPRFRLASAGSSNGSDSR